MQIYRDRIVNQDVNALSYRKIGNSRLLKLAAFLRRDPAQDGRLRQKSGDQHEGEQGNDRRETAPGVR